MAPQKKKVRRVNLEKKAKKDAKKKTAIDGISKARKALEDGREKVKERKARKEKLENDLKNAAEEEAKAMKMEIDKLEDQLQKDERDLKDAEAEEEKFKKDEEDADEEDEYDEMDVDQENDTTTNVRPSTENEELLDDFAKRMQGLQIAEEFDLSRNVQLRPTQKLICYKGVGFGKPGIVEDFEVPNCLIYRYRNDVQIDEDTPDLMKWRRAGKVNPKTGKKWGVGDMVKILPHIAIQVPPGYEGNPEDLVKLIPKISGTERDALKNAGKRIPKQPEVQMLITWKEGISIEGESEKCFASWESRSGCRTLWKKQHVADDWLVTVAESRERAYRKAGGRNSSERSPSPFEFPDAGSSPDREYSLTPEGEEAKNKDDEEKKKQEEEKKKKEEAKKREEENRKKEDEEKRKKEEKGSFDASEYKAASDDFELKYRARKGWAADAALTPTEEADLIDAFDYIWAKKQAAKKDSKL